MNLDGNIKKFNAFVTVADLGNFSRAAKQLAYTESGISKMIRSLEKDWNIILFHRSAGEGSVQLTAEGEQLLPLARKLCSDYINICTEITNINDMYTGTIRIGSLTSITATLLPPVIEKFHKDYPNIEYELLWGDYSDIETWLQTGRIDCGFLPFVHSKKLEEKMDVFFVVEDEYVAVVAPDHPFANRHRISLEELSHEPLIMLDHGNALKEGYDLFASNNIIPDKVLIRTWDDSAICSMVARGIGVTIESKLIVQTMPYNLVTIPLTRPMIRKLYFVIPSYHSAPKTVRTLLQYLKNTVHPDTAIQKD